MLVLHTLGGLRLEGEALPALTSRRKELVLLAYLARHAPRPLRRAELADLLWGDRDERKARQSLRQALLELKRIAGPGLQADAEVVCLGHGAVLLDARQFEIEVGEGRFEEAVARWDGDFLLGLDDLGAEGYRIWLEREREGFRRLLATALDGLVTRAESRAEWAQAVRWAERWAELLPLDERGHERLARALRIDGRSAEALAHLSRYLVRAREELGGASPALVRLGAELEEEARRTAAPLPPAAALFTPDLIGRDEEFRELVAAWEAVRAGAARAVLLEGEAGLGKTRLGQEFLQWLRSQPEPPVVLCARAYEAERDLPWRAVGELLAPLARAPGIVAAPEPTLAALAAIVPAIRERFPRLPTPSADDHTLADAVRRALGEVAHEVPVVAFLDDLPAADEPSRTLVVSLLRRPPPGVLLMVAGRDEDRERIAPSAEFSGPSGLRMLRLQRLDPAQVEALLASALALPGDERRVLAARLHAESGGNPFYAIELLRALAEEGRLRPDPNGVWRLVPGPPGLHLPLPGSLRDAVGRRLAKLSPDAREAAQAGAVLELPFDLGLLGEVAGLSAVAAEAALEELILRRVAQQAAGAPGRFEFSDEVVRRQAYQSMPVDDRARLLRRAAAALERRAATDPAAGAALARLRLRGAPTRPEARRRWLVGAATALGLAIGAGALALHTGRGHPAAPPAVVAVLPFSVRGSPELGYLREGMVTLLSARLDAAGVLRAADPRAILGVWAQERSDAPEVERGRRVADRLGAGTYVLGDVVEVGGRVRLEAAAYRPGSPEPLAQAGVEGAPDELFRLTDALAAGLLPGLTRGPNPRLTRVAAGTTHSLPALKAYLEGERLFRDGRFLAAVEAFQRAVEDTAFALAYYWLSVAAWWADQSDLVRPAAERAVRHAARLPERDRRLVEAWDLLLKGDAVEAERRYRALLGVEPENVEAWTQLGELLFHYAPRRGRPIGDAREPFERVLALEPEHISALLHLARIAASERRHVALDSLLRRILALDPPGDWALEARSLQAFALRDRDAARRVTTELAKASDGRIWNIARYAAALAGNVEAARELTRLLTDPSRAPEVRAFGHVALGYLALAEGRQAETFAELERAARLDSATALEHRALLVALPFLPVPTEELAATRDALARWNATETAPLPGASHVGSVHHAVHPHLRAYLLAVLSLRLGDRRAAALYADHLGRLGGPPEVARFAREAARSVRAQLAWREGRAADAVREFEDALRREVMVDLIGASPFYARDYERYRFGQLLEDLGRREEAARWYASFDDNSIFALMYLAPSRLRRGVLAEQAGALDAAAEHYRRALALWAGADSGLRPLVDSAQHRLAALAGSIANAPGESGAGGSNPPGQPRHPRRRGAAEPGRPLRRVPGARQPLRPGQDEPPEYEDERQHVRQRVPEPPSQHGGPAPGEQHGPHADQVGDQRKAALPDVRPGAHSGAEREHQQHPAPEPQEVGRGGVARGGGSGARSRFSGGTDGGMRAASG